MSCYSSRWLIRRVTRLGTEKGDVVKAQAKTRLHAFQNHNFNLLLLCIWEMFNLTQNSRYQTKFDPCRMPFSKGSLALLSTSTAHACICLAQHVAWGKGSDTGIRHILLSFFAFLAVISIQQKKSTNANYQRHEKYVLEAVVLYRLEMTRHLWMCFTGLQNSSKDRV